MKPNEDPANRYPGMAEDVADGEKATNKLVREDVSQLNSNPRNCDGPRPEKHCS